MNIHPFGAVPSAGAANFGLRMTAEAGPEESGQKVADFLQNEFYVDNSSIRGLTCRGPLQRPEGLDVRHDVLQVKRSLGSCWDIESDTIGFYIDLKDKPLTRRGVLSGVCFLHDPLRRVSTVILRGR